MITIPILILWFSYFCFTSSTLGLFALFLTVFTSARVEEEEPDRSMFASLFVRAFIIGAIMFAIAKNLGA